MATSAKIEITAKDKTKGAFRSINKSLTTVTKSVFSFQGAILAAVGVGGLGSLIKTSLAAGDALGKTADKLGTTTKELAGLRHAAELSGVSTKTLDTSMQRFTRRLSEASQGLGAGKKGLDSLGLSASYLLTLPLGKQMQAVADAMGGLTTQADRVRVAASLFDQEGVNLVNTLAAGSKGLQQATDEAEKFGLALSRADAYKIEAVNDSFTRVAASIRGVGLKLTAELAPYIKAVSDRFIGMAGNAGSWSDAIVSAIGSVGKAFGFVGNSIRGMKIIFIGVQLAITKGAEVILNTLYKIADGWRQISNLIPGINVAPLTGFNTLVTETQIATAALSTELQTLAMMTLPSQRIAEEFELIKTNADENAAMMAESRLAQQELELTQTAQHNKKLVTLETKKISTLVKSRKKELTDLQKFNAMSWKGQVGQVAGSLEQMTRGVAQQSKAMFNLNKVSGIANAIINTATGVTQALAAYPPPLSFGMAAAQLAAGIAQVNMIKGTSFGGGGAPSLSGSGSGSIAPTPTIDAVSPTEQFSGETEENNKTVTINLLGDTGFSKDQVRDLIEQINEEIGDGATLVSA